MSSLGPKQLASCSDLPIVYQVYFIYKYSCTHSVWAHTVYGQQPINIYLKSMPAEHAAAKSEMNKLANTRLGLSK